MSRQHIKSRNAARKTKMETRTSQALALLETGKGVVAVARELGVNRKTVYRNLKKIADQKVADNAEQFDQLRARHHAELRTMMDFVLNSPEMTDADVAGYFRLYQSDIAKLLGLNREKNTTNVAVMGANLTPEYIQIAKAMADVAPEDRPKVLDFIRSLVKPLELTADCFPEAE